MTDRKMSEAIAELARKTQDDEIQWIPSDDIPAHLTQGSEDVVDLVYTAEYQNKKFRIYKRRYKDYFNWNKSFRWETMLVFELQDNLGRPTYKFPEVSEIYALWDAIQAQTSGVDELVGHLTGSL